MSDSDDPRKLYEAIIERAKPRNEYVSLPDDPNREEVLEAVKTTTKPVYLICVRKSDYEAAPWRYRHRSEMTDGDCEWCKEPIMVSQREIKATRICLQCAEEHSRSGNA